MDSVRIVLSIVENKYDFHFILEVMLMLGFIVQTQPIIYSVITKKTIHAVTFCNMLLGFFFWKANMLLGLPLSFDY
jgi:hypothetical protein